MAVFAGIVLMVLYALALFADFIAPYGYDSEDRTKSYLPPTRLRMVDAEGNFHWRPFIYNYKFEFDEYYRRVYLPDTERRYPLKIFTRGEVHKILWLFETDLHLFGTDAPSRIYLLGADSRGRDIFSRLLYGSRISLSIGFVGSFVALVIGMTIGGISGYFRGKVDTVLMRVVEMVMMIPGFYLLLSLRAALPPELSSKQVYFFIVFIMSFIGWAGLARVIRGMILAESGKEYILAAKSMGAGDLRIILRHALPNTLSYVIVAVTIGIPGYILGESALSLLGLGIQDPDASWGNMLSDAMSIAEIRFHPWILLPGVFIFVAIMAYNFLGDGLRDAFDPRTGL
jgi:peptide/nickel transport system permease protein